MSTTTYPSPQATPPYSPKPPPPDQKYLIKAEEKLFKRLLNELSTNKKDDNLKFACLLIFNKLSNLHQQNKLSKSCLLQFYQLISLEFVIKLLKHGEKERGERTGPLVSQNQSQNQHQKRKARDKDKNRERQKSETESFSSPSPNLPTATPTLNASDKKEDLNSHQLANPAINSNTSNSNTCTTKFNNTSRNPSKDSDKSNNSRSSKASSKSNQSQGLSQSSTSSASSSSSCSGQNHEKRKSPGSGATNSNANNDFVNLAIQILTSIFNLQLTRENFMENFQIDQLVVDDKNLLFRKFPAIFMDRIDFYTKNNKPVELVYYLNNNFVVVEERETIKGLPNLKGSVKEIFKTILKTKHMEPKFIKILFNVIVKFAEQLLVKTPYGSNEKYRPTNSNIDFEFQALVATRANTEIRFWVELGNLEFSDGHDKLENFDAEHFHNCLKIVEKFNNLLEFLEELDEDLDSCDKMAISDLNMEFIFKADEFATRTMLSLVQHLIEVNVRGDPESLKFKNKSINNSLSEAGRCKAENIKSVSIFSTFSELQFEHIYKTISYFYSLSIHIDNTIKLTPDFPTWLINTITLIKSKNPDQKSTNTIISTFSPVMFKLLIMADGTTILNDDFYTFTRKEFLPIIETSDKSIHSQFIEVLEDMGQI